MTEKETPRTRGNRRAGASGLFLLVDFSERGLSSNAESLTAPVQALPETQAGCAIGGLSSFHLNAELAEAQRLAEKEKGRIPLHDSTGRGWV